MPFSKFGACKTIVSDLETISRLENPELEVHFKSIDEKLALAIQSTGLAPGGEPINPVQAAIAGLIQNMATNQQNPKRIELKRDEKGLFEKQE